MAKKGFGTELFEKTKMPFRQEDPSPALQESIQAAQLIIREFEIRLMELAQDGDESAVDGLTYANVISTGLTANQFGSILEKQLAIKNYGKTS